MKRKRNLLFIFLIMLLGMIGVTYAYYTESESFENNFIVSNFNVTIDENFDTDFYVTNTIDYIPKEVYITNNEDVDAIVRVSYNEWFDDEELPDYGDYKYLLNTGVDQGRYYFDWTDDFSNYFYDNYDGWYYYEKVLPANSSVLILYGVVLDFYFSPRKGNYNLDFNIEAVQATPEAVKEVWGWDIEILEDGSVYYDFPA